MLDLSNSRSETLKLSNCLSNLSTQIWLCLSNSRPIPSSVLAALRIAAVVLIAEGITQIEAEIERQDLSQEEEDSRI